MFEKKTVLERYEEQFKVSEMQNKHIFYDLYARVGDPEELRGYVTELLKSLDWKTSVNELMKFEEAEVEGMFRGGRLKPIKTIMKAYKQFKKGPRYPLIWKLLTLIGIGFLVFYFYTLIDTARVWNSNMFLFGSIAWFILAILVYSIKEVVSMAIWLKISGIYNIADEKADVRVVIAGDADKKDAEAFKVLEEDVSELYNSLIRRYVKTQKKPITKTEIIKEIKPKRNALAEIAKSSKEIEKDLANLAKQLAAGKISEEAYKEAKKDLERRKAKLETILDLLSV
ncbi:MAG: hypothetical protein J7K22_00950 [Nanoarchaeota archaeon]|nr:hypothetical protein [Nanoarchaeota archaeon]